MKMSCKKIGESLPGFALSELDDGEVAEVDEHLQSCGTCRQELEGIRQALGLLPSWEAPAATEGLVSRTLQALQAEQKGPKSWEERYHNFVYWLSNLEITPARGMLATACGFCLFFLLLQLDHKVPRAAAPASQLARCRSNLDTLVRASQRYQEDRGELPDRVDVLHGQYIGFYPVCPSAGYDTYSESFLVRADGERLILYCNGHHHAKAELGPNEPRQEVP